MIVFTGKTFGLQLVELAKPFIKKNINVVLENMSMKSVVKSAQALTEGVGGLVVKVGEGVVDIATTEAVLGPEDSMEAAERKEEEAMVAERNAYLKEREENFNEDNDADALLRGEGRAAAPPGPRQKWKPRSCSTRG